MDNILRNRSAVDLSSARNSGKNDDNHQIYVSMDAKKVAVKIVQEEGN
jgi:hypothetical protein